MKQRILAIDDEIHMLKLLERIITEKTPYQIQTTNNALELPGILQHDEFDVIITDLKMPGMDGLDVLRLVKQQGRREEVIIIDYENRRHLPSDCVPRCAKAGRFQSRVRAWPVR